MKIKRGNKWLLIFGILLILFPIFIISFDIYKNTKKEIQEVELIEDFFQEVPDELEESMEEDVSAQEKKVETSSPTYNYVAILEIPSIGLKRGLVDFNSKYNNVKYNIQIIEHSDFPIVENSNLILASHNGSSNVSFFKNLYKVKEDSLIYIYYDGYKYIYKLNHSYDTAKDGKVEIRRSRYKTTITLITCKKNTENIQTVYIGYLVDKVEY